MNRRKLRLAVLSFCNFAFPYLLLSVTDFCAESPCQNGGNCTQEGIEFSCECAEGFEGDTCETSKGSFWHTEYICNAD